MADDVAIEQRFRRRRRSQSSRGREELWLILAKNRDEGECVKICVCVREEEWKSVWWLRGKCGCSHVRDLQRSASSF